MQQFRLLVRRSHRWLRRETDANAGSSSGMAAAAALAVLAGFAPTYYFEALLQQARALSPLLHVHGIVFSLLI